MAATGVAVLPPDDWASGGTDFTSQSDLRTLRSKLKELSDQGHHLMLHFAPPCATFSLARNRAKRTQLRSSAYPGGLPRLSPASRIRVADANLVATESFALAAWAFGELRALVTLENPHSSYLWQFMDHSDVEQGTFSDRTFSQCMYGTPYRKDTRLRVWGAGLPDMNRRCSSDGQTFTCGRTTAEGHTVLGFGGASTAAAAAYPEGVCKAWAQAIAAWAKTPTAADRVTTISDGRVRRHIDRGLTATSLAEVRKTEDLACLAGMRNPHQVVGRWPQLSQAMHPVYLALRGFLQRTPGAQNLWRACGDNTRVRPPSPELVTAAREEVAMALGLSFGEAEEHHSASPWKFNLVRQVVERSADPDTHIAQWLQHGAPAGLSAEICSLFPAVSPTDVLPLEALESLSKSASNHPSFDEAFGEEVAPGVNIIQGYVDAGFGELFHDQAAAEKALGGTLFPAPLGNVTKVKPDGGLKHRVIQDLRANSVNKSIRLPERQVLPRPIDHARDLADLTAVEPGMATLIMDFKDAFMSIPLLAEERRFCCASVPQGLERRRQGISTAEPPTGNFVVWRVLGFGGRSFPLVFSRAASFAARSAQALFSTGHNNEAAARLQLYVDDPVLTLSSPCSLTRRRGADLVLWWWLVLGIPLAWEKGRWEEHTVCHAWIGVVFTAARGEAVMTLPRPFVDELIELLKPLTSSKGHLSEKALLTIIGKCNRVAQIVPEARPFVGAMYAALTGAQHSRAAGRKEAPPGRHPARRFTTAARWMVQVLTASGPVFPLERRIQAGGPSATPVSDWVAQFDASPWGGGAILKNEGVIRKFWATAWSQEDFSHLNVRIGEPSAQCFLEFLTLFMCLELWGDPFVQESLQIVGDNVGALESALQLKGAGPMLAIARELAWRKARRRWSYQVGHISTEDNLVPDALSRLHDPNPSAFPCKALAHAQHIPCPAVQGLWVLKESP